MFWWYVIDCNLYCTLIQIRGEQFHLANEQYHQFSLVHAKVIHLNRDKFFPLDRIFIINLRLYPALADRYHLRKRFLSVQDRNPLLKSHLSRPLLHDVVGGIFSETDEPIYKHRDTCHIRKHQLPNRSYFKNWHCAHTYVPIKNKKNVTN